MDSVTAFNVFVRVAETRSFVAAGKLLGVSSSAVGKSVTRLEKRLGVRLFHRSTRSVTLTVEGELFLQRSRHILTEIDAAEDELSQASGSPRGRLRISLPILSKLFLPSLAKFQKAYPDVELDLDFNDRKVDIIEEGFDAVIRSGEVQDSRLTAKRLDGFRMVLVGSPDYFSRRGVPTTPSDLTDHSCIQFRFPNTGKLQPWTIPDSDYADLQIPATIVCNTLEARLCFCLQGLGIAYLADFAVREDIERGRLVTILDEYMTAGSNFHLLWPASRYVPPKLRVFIDFLAP
ncbi:LysR family transcriptional regulator [Paraburkholderia agricolaris]|uniref:LysR family transcriptional regulator n=1 Tax=Paraburkholderia agricolaris TaxID=2152888 RepID=A0ABW9A1G1_9BURK